MVEHLIHHIHKENLMVHTYGEHSCMIFFLIYLVSILQTLKIVTNHVQWRLCFDNFDYRTKSWFFATRIEYNL